MLNPRADGKGLLLHGQTQRVQPAAGVPGAVADGQKNGIRFEKAFFGFVFVGGDILHAADLAVPKALAP